MKVIRIPSKWRFLTGLAAVVLVGSLLLAAVFGVFAEGTQTPYHDEPVKLDDADKSAHTSAQLVFYRGPTDESPAYVLVDVVVDEEFVNHIGKDWENRVREIVRNANKLNGQVGLNLKVVSVQRWRSDDAEATLEALLNSAERQTHRNSGNLLLAITCQDTVKYDGLSQTSERAVIVQYYHKHQERNAALIAHEVGHILGARHHEQEDECDGDGCIMDREGYDHASQWCHHHEEQIQKSIAATLASQGA